MKDLQETKNLKVFLFYVIIIKMKKFINKLKKMLGHRHENRYSWGELGFHFNPKQWQLALYLSDGYDESNDILIVKPFIFSLYLNLPTKICKEERYDRKGTEYGFYFYDRVFNLTNIVLLWGTWREHIEMPWNLKWESTEILDFNRNRKHIQHFKDKNRRLHDDTRDQIEKENSQTFPYTYVLKNGILQNRKATIHVERWIYHRRWFPWSKHINTTIDVSFNNEIGEKSGSWKGGVMGVSFKLFENETPEQCIERMQREYKC